MNRYAHSTSRSSLSTNAVPRVLVKYTVYLMVETKTSKLNSVRFLHKLNTETFMTAFELFDQLNKKV